MKNEEIEKMKTYYNKITCLRKKQQEYYLTKNIKAEQLGKSTINTPTKQKDIAYDKVISKVHERNHTEEIHEHRIEK